MGIVASGYPTRELADLGLENKYLAYYATKMVLWCYLISDWNINDLKVNPSLSGDDLTRAQSVLAAAQRIYHDGMIWEQIPNMSLTCTADQPTAYPVTIGGVNYKQQVFTVTSGTWIGGLAVNVSFANPSAVPAGTRIVNMSDQDTNTISVTGSSGTDLTGQFKVLYPVDSIAEQTGSVQLNIDGIIFRYGIYYAVCAESGHGTLQNYMCDTDPITPIDLSAISNYSDTSIPTPTPTPPPDGDLKIIKKESSTGALLADALFEVIDPSGATIGTFATDASGEINVPLSHAGNYTVIERMSAPNHKMAGETTQNVTVENGKTATVTFFNDPYGTLRVQKLSDTGEYLEGVTVQVKNIETGAVYSEKTGPAGAAIFDELEPGSYEVQETAGVTGWLADTDTVQTVQIVTGETSTVTFTNKELPGLRILKYDRKTMKVMSKVTFKIFRDDVFLGTFQTDAMGEILLPDCQPGTYRAVEVDTGNDGYLLSTIPQEVELQAGDGIKELTFFKDVKPGMHLIKVDAKDPSRTIAGAVFEIKAVDGSWGPREFTTGANGEVDLSKLPAGAYVVTEKSCPGYVIDEAQRVIELKPNETAEFIFTNTKTPSLLLEKRSADGSALAGVTFRITPVEDRPHSMDRTTDENGRILIEDLKPGVYSIIETATLPDHILAPVEHLITLYPGQTSTITLKNDRRPKLIIEKRDADTGEVIPHTIFTVRAADGHSIDQVETGADGKATLENLLPGVYEISEKSVPAEYLLDAPSQLVTLYPNREHTVHFENHKKPSIIVKKVDSVTGETIQGAEFHVWYGSNNTATGELNTVIERVNKL